AKVARAREFLRVGEEVSRSLVGFEPLAEDDARPALQLQSLQFALAPRPDEPSDVCDDAEAERENENLRELREARVRARLERAALREEAAEEFAYPLEELFDEALECVA